MSVRPEAYGDVADVDLDGSTILVTGSSDGIGREAALAFGRLGAEVLIHGRSTVKAQSVAESIRTDGGTATVFTADFTSLAAVRALAADIREAHDSLDVLANNVGASFTEARMTDVGVEATMTVNHLAPFLLTHHLLPLLPDGGRIVTTASGAHRGATIDVDAWTDPASFSGFRTYSESKLANILFTRELAGRLADRTANCFHPGFVPGSALWREAPIYVKPIMWALATLPGPLQRRLLDTPATGAATLVYLAASPSVADTTGEYFADCEVALPSETAQDDELARDLWEQSETLVDLEESYRLD